MYFSIWIKKPNCSCFLFNFSIVPLKNEGQQDSTGYRKDRKVLRFLGQTLRQVDISLTHHAEIKTGFTNTIPKHAADFSRGEDSQLCSRETSFRQDY